MVIAAAGDKKCSLPTSIPGDLALPAGFSDPRLALPGVLIVQGLPCEAKRGVPVRRIIDSCAAIPLGALFNSLTAGGQRRRQKLRRHTLDNLL